MILDRPVALREWRPQLPAGDLRSIFLHWTGGDYTTVHSAYHFCLSGTEEILVHHTHDLRDNMRNVRLDPSSPYAAHTAGRNSWSIGLSIAAMREATPADFGPFPVTAAQIDALCRVAARLARFYEIDVAAIRTHAEAALEDGYFGDGDDERWDIARLRPSAEPLVPDEAQAVGELFRERIGALLQRARAL
jgi:hypothetical protein